VKPINVVAIFAPILSASILAAALQSSAVATDKTTLKPTDKTTAGQSAASPAQYMIFPDDYSIGKIYILPKVWNVQATPMQVKFFAEAKGRLRVQPGATYALTVNELASERPEYLSHFPPGTLRSLNSGYITINDNYLRAIGKLSSLQRLDLNETDLEDRHLVFLKDLKEMRNLSLNKTLLKGPGLVNLAGMKELLFVNLSGNNLQQGSIKHLVHFAHINDLACSHCLLTDSEMIEIAKIKSLTQLTCSFNNGITDSGIKYLEALPNLSSLDVDETHVTVNGLLTLRTRRLYVISLPARFNNKRDLAIIHSAFPHATLGFSGRTKIEPVEFFDPKNLLGR